MNRTATFTNITPTVAAGTTISILDLNSDTVVSGTFAAGTSATTSHVKAFHRR